MKFIMIICLAVISSCASIHKGEYAKEVSDDGKVQVGKKTKSGIVMSGSEVTKMASKYFTQLDFTFENTTNEWIKIDRVSISYMNGKLDELVKVPLGQKLDIWAKAAQQNKAIANHNMNMILGGVAGLATIGGSFSKNARTRKAAVGILSASGGLYSYNSIKSKLNSVELAKVAPESHLLNTPIFIPPGLHVKKWVTIHLKDPYKSPYLSKVKVSYRVNKQKTEAVLLELRGTNTSSSFQNRYQNYWKKKTKQEAKKKKGFNPYVN